MPLNIDQIDAHVVRDPPPESPTPPPSRVPPAHDLEEQIRIAMAREAHRQQRLSDR